MNKSSHCHKMVSFYQMVGITKQAHYKRVNYQLKMERLTNDVITNADKIRQEHKRMGCRKLYHEIKPEGIGRDKTESILLSNGFRVKRKRNYHRTTYAGRHWYSNHISKLKVSDVNQLWVSDITYIPVSYKKHYYLTLILDVYSRKIVGWCLSRVMQAELTVLPAYQKAITAISDLQREGLIFHSDRGSQYAWKRLGELHAEHGVTPSMGGKAWENAHAESINGILKNEYIDFEGMNISFSEARIMIDSIVKKYNEQRPHGSLKNMKPVEFEKYVKQLTNREKPIFEINY